MAAAIIFQLDGEMGRWHPLAGHLGASLIARSSWPLCSADYPFCSKGYPFCPVRVSRAQLAPLASIGILLALQLPSPKAAQTSSN